MSSDNYRVSQRRPQACQECTKRKRKCDKELPCGRCRRLKLDCTRETVRLRNLSAKHADEVAFLESIKRDLLAGSSFGGGSQRLPDANSAVVSRLEARIALLQFGTDAATMAVGNRSSTEGDATATLAPLKQAYQESVHSNSITPTGPASTITPPTNIHAKDKDTDASILTALEYMAWGRSFGGCYPHLSCACNHHRGFNMRVSNNVASISSTSLQRIASNLPNVADAKRLVEFHVRHLAWHHNCLHSGTFLEKCEIFWRTGGVEHPQWLAAYLAVLSSTVYCVQNSQKFSTQLGIDLSLVSALGLFKDMLDVLYSEDFLGEVSLYSVQAIVISTEVAHNLGFSQLNAILIGAAIRIAQCLGLHKIASRDTNSLQSQGQWHELVDLEVGKRIWCQMIIQDLFAIPFNDSYGILPPHCSTDLPMNCDDDLVPRDPNTPTVSSYCRVLAQLALLMPEMAEGLGPVKQRKPLQQQYEHVLRMDRKMREMVRQIPSFLLREDNTVQSKAPWLSIARRSLAITAADKIIMIHRPFLFRAFQSPTTPYSYTRRTCVAAAMTILREHEAITATDDLSIWTHSAFCITAAVILSFEVSYRVSTANNNSTTATVDNTYSDDNEKTNRELVEQYRAAISAARNRLVARNNDVLASRGVTLIDVISLEETAFDHHTGSSASTSSASKIIDLPRVVENFFAVNKFDSLSRIHGGNGSASGSVRSGSILGAPFSPFDVDVAGGDMLGATPGEPFFDDGSGVGGSMSMHDFDEWYNNTFNEGQHGQQQSQQRGYPGGFV